MPSTSKTTINWWQKRHASSSAPRKSAHWTLGCPHAAWPAVEGAKLLHVTHLSHLPTCRNPQQSRKKTKEYPQLPETKTISNTQWVKYVYCPALVTLEVGHARRNHSTHTHFLKNRFSKSFCNTVANIPEARAKGFFPKNCCPPHSSLHLPNIHHPHLICPLHHLQSSTPSSLDLHLHQSSPSSSSSPTAVSPTLSTQPTHFFHQPHLYDMLHLQHIHYLHHHLHH